MCGKTYQKPPMYLQASPYDYTQWYDTMFLTTWGSDTEPRI